MSKGVLEQRKKLLGVMNAVNKKFGAGTMSRASRVAFSHLRRIPFGVFNLDVDTGGGVPKGRIILLTGEESVCKTTLCKALTGQFQHTCRQCLKPFEWYTDEQVDPVTGEMVGEGDMVVVKPCPCGANEPHVVAYFDAEGGFDPVWAAHLGVDVPSLLVVQPEWAEQGIDAINALIRTGELDLLITDSVATMTPGREVEESAESGQRPDLALAMNRFMRTLQSSLNHLGMDNPNKPAIVLVNQTREKVGVMYGDPTTIPGGHGQKFAASIRIDLRGGKAIDIQGNVGGKKPEKIGKEFHYTISKNKTFVPYRKGSFKLFFDEAPHLGVRKGTFNNFEQMVAYASHVGLIEQSGAWLDLQPAFGEEFANPDSGSGKFQGLESLMEFLRENPDKAEAVKERVLHEVKMSTTGRMAQGNGEEVA